MRAFLMLLLLGLVPAQVTAQSEKQAYLMLVRDLVDQLVPADPLGARRSDRPLLVDVESFAYLGRFAAREPIEQSAVAAIIGRPFVNMRESTATECQEPCATWRDGNFIQLNGALRIGPILELTVTEMSTDDHYRRGKILNIRRLRLTYEKQEGKWVLAEKETLSET